MPFDAILELLDQADGVVTHAGVGSVLGALEAGHTPIIVPRLARLGEHVDDHQSDFARALEARGEVVVLWEGDGLPDALRRAGARGGPRALLESPLHAAIRAAIE
jgi:UDP-N-acetylglucosamine transferase subunit ALG13